MPASGKSKGAPPGLRRPSACAAVATLPRHYLAYMLMWDHVADRPGDVPKSRQKEVAAAREHARQRRLCYLCCGRLVPIGVARANGRTHKDWLSRHYHKACWKDILVARRELCSCGTARLAVSRELKAFPVCDCKAKAKSPGRPTGQA